MKLLIINFKTYESGTGKKGERIAEICKKLSSKNIVIAAQAVDIHRLSRQNVRVFAQHIEPVLPGKNTGFVTAESVKSAGASGTLLNHAEHKIPIGMIQKSVERAKENGLLTVACAATAKEAEEIASACSPDYIAIETPELIGGNVSVSTANPGIITETIKAVQRIKKIPVICGAGVSGSADVKKAIELGAEGVLVANYVMGADDKKKAVSELLKGLKSS